MKCILGIGYVDVDNLVFYKFNICMFLGDVKIMCDLFLNKVKEYYGS